jgi:hypothetical protein
VLTFHASDPYHPFEQVRLFEFMRDTSLLKMYGGSIEKYLRDLAYIRTVCPSAQELYTSVAVILPRRSGKTMVQALVATCIVLSMPRGNVLTYNMTHAQAKTWFHTAYNYMMLLKDDSAFGWKIEHIEGGKSIRIIKTGSIGGGNHQQTGILVYGNAKDERNAQNLRGMTLMILISTTFFLRHGWRCDHRAAGRRTLLLRCGIYRDPARSGTGRGLYHHEQPTSA